MRNSLRSIIAAAALAGLLIPSFIVSFCALIALSAAVPLAGLLLGFLMDLVFGYPYWLPSVIAYPFTLIAAAIGLGSLVLTKYLR